MTGVVTDFLNTISPLFTRHLSESCLGHISEIFSGTEPWAPHGSIAKAWSEAEVYRAPCSSPARPIRKRMNAGRST